MTSPIISALTLLNILLGFGFQVLLTGIFGAGRDMDIFWASAALPSVLVAIITGTLSYSLIPVLIEEEKKSEAEAGSTLSCLINYASLFLLAATGLGTIFSGGLLSILAPGIQGDERRMASDLFSIQVSALVPAFLAAAATCFHYTHGSFILPSLGQVLGMSVSIATTAEFADEWGTYAPAVSVTLSYVVQACMLSPKMASQYSLRFWKASPGLKKVLRLQLPLLSGSAYYKLDPLIDRNLASRMMEGSISYLGYANQLAAGLASIVTRGASVTSFPSMSRMAVKEDMERIADYLSRLLKVLVFYSVPIAVFLIACAREVMAILFERGRFNTGDTEWLSLSLVCYMGVFIGGAMGTILANTFYALQDTRTPTIIGVIGFTTGVVMKVLLSDEFGFLSIAVASSIYYLINVSLEIAVLKKRLKGVAWRNIMGFTFKTLTISIFALAPIAVVNMFEFSLLTATLIQAALYLILYLGIWRLVDPSYIRNLLAVKWTR
jgi:putative peptidoglycan lipid II flippase